MKLSGVYNNCYLTQGLLLDYRLRTHVDRRYSGPILTV